MKKSSIKHNDLTFIVEQDLPEVGWYIYIYDENNNCIADYLQDSLEQINAFLHDEYEVPLNMLGNK